MSQPVEYWPIVSKRNDKVLRIATKAQCHGEPKEIHRTSGVLVTTTDGLVILQRRAPLKEPYGGFLGISASGHVQYLPDLSRFERYRETAMRETQEELGIEPDSLSFVTRIRIDDPNHPTWTSIYKTVSDGPFTPQLEELEGLEFFQPEDLVNHRDSITPPSLRMLTALGLIPLI